MAMSLFSLCFYQWDLLKSSCGQHYPLLLIFFIICLSLIYTDNMAVGLHKVQRVALIPAAILVFSFIELPSKRVFLILKLFVLLVLCTTLYSHIQTIGLFIANAEPSFRNFFNLNYSYQALGSTVNLHPTYYSYFILSAISILLYFLRNKSTLPFKILMFLIIIYFSFFIVHLSSRIAIVVLYLLFIFNILFFAIKHKALVKSLVWLTVLHLLLAFTILNIGVTKYRFQHIFGFTYYTGYKVNDGHHKLKLWNAALSANENFLIGNGMGDVDASLKEAYTKVAMTKAAKEDYNSHNQYIEYYVGLGVIGLVTFCFLLAYYSIHFYKRKNLLGFQFMAITATICITECLFTRHHGLAFFVFMLGLLWKLQSEPLENENKVLPVEERA